MFCIVVTYKQTETLRSELSMKSR